MVKRGKGTKKEEDIDSSLILWIARGRRLGFILRVTTARLTFTWRLLRIRSKSRYDTFQDPEMRSNGIPTFCYYKNGPNLKLRVAKGNKLWNHPVNHCVYCSSDSALSILSSHAVRRLDSFFQFSPYPLPRQTIHNVGRTFSRGNYFHQIQWGRGTAHDAGAADVTFALAVHV